MDFAMLLGIERMIDPPDWRSVALHDMTDLQVLLE